MPILRSAAITLIITIGGVIATYCLHILLTHWLNAAAYGCYVYVWSWATLLSIPATLGFPTALVRFIPQYVTTGDFRRLRGIIRYSIVGVLTCALTIAIAGSIGVAWLGSDPFYRSALAFALCGVPLVALVTLLSEGLRARNRVATAYLPFQVLRPIAIACSAYLIFFARGELTVLSTTAATIIAFAVILIIQMPSFRRSLPAELSRTEPILDTMVWMRVALPLGAAAVFNASFDYTSTMLIGLMLKPSDVGMYYIASRNAALITFVILSINTLAAPVFSSLHSRGDHRALQELVTKLSHAIFWPSLAVAFLICVLARPLLALFGPTFVQARPILVVLAIGQVASAGAGSVGYLLQMTGHQIANLKVLTASAIVNVILNLLLIPVMGCMGAALASSTTVFLWNVWLHRLVVVRLGVDPSILAAFCSLLTRASRGLA